MDGTDIVPCVGDPTVDGKCFCISDGVLAKGGFFVSNDHIQIVDDMFEVAADDVVELKMSTSRFVWVEP